MGEGRGRPVNKLQTTRKGPMRVVSQQDDTYELLDLVSRKIDTIHVSRIYPFKYDSTKVDPENVAIRDQGEFIVESIIDSIIDKNLPRTTWSFRVRWLGFDDTYDEWLGWNELRNVEALHHYLRCNGLAKYIPKSAKAANSQPEQTQEENSPDSMIDIIPNTLLKPNSKRRR